jgi:hypothetical protein
LIQAKTIRRTRTQKLKDENYLELAETEGRHFWSIYRDAIFKWRQFPRWRDIEKLNGFNQHREMFYRPGEWDAFYKAVQDAYDTDPRIVELNSHDEY